MAQAELRSLTGTGSKGMRLKLRVTRSKAHANEPVNVSSFSNGQLADLHAAVEAFCKQGIHGIPGVELLLPWIEQPPVQPMQQLSQQQASAMPLEPLQQPQQQQQSQHEQHQQQPQQPQVLSPTSRRVRKRRAPDTEQAAATEGMQFEAGHVSWGGVRRARCSQPARSARSALQLANSVQRMLQQQPQPPQQQQLPQLASQAAAAPTPAGSQPSTAHAAAKRNSSSSRLSPGVGSRANQAARPQQKSMLKRSASATFAAFAAPAVPTATPAACVLASSTAATAAVATAVQPLLPEPVGPARAATAAAASGQKAAHVCVQNNGVAAMDIKNGEEPGRGNVAVTKEAATAASKQPARQAASSQQEPKAAPAQPPPAAAATADVHYNAVFRQLVQQGSNNARVQQHVVPPEGSKQPAKQQQLGQQLLPPQQQIPAVALKEQSPAPAVGATQITALQEAAAAADMNIDMKPDSPPSETSHQQHIAPQHLQQLLPSNVASANSKQQQPHEAQLQQQQQEGEVQQQLLLLQDLQQHKQPEQTAVSRDRSQCSLPRGADAALGMAAVNTPAPAAVLPEALTAPTAATGAGGSAVPGRLLDLAPGSMTPAAVALAGLSAAPVAKQRILPPDDKVLRTEDDAITYLSSIMEKAKQLKHQGDKRQKVVGSWDVYGLSFYALSTVEFLMYWDTSQKLLRNLHTANQPVRKLQAQLDRLANNSFLKQTGGLSTTAMTICSNCKGPDVAKQALRMLLERLSAICHMRNLYSRRKFLEGDICLLKSGGSSVPASASSSVSSAANVARSSARGPQQQYQQQQRQVQMQRSAAAVPAGCRIPSTSSTATKTCSPGGSWSPVGQQGFNKRSPDDSNTSNQERVQLPLGPDPGHVLVSGVAGVGGQGAMQQEVAQQLVKAEKQLMETMQDLLRMTDGMHQTVMRMQQFLESPEVLTNEHARAAAVHISVLGLDAGMFSIPRVAAHTEAAVMCIMKLLRNA